MIRSYKNLTLNVSEILRYAKTEGKELPKEASAALDSLPETIMGRVVYEFYDIKETDGVIDLGFTKTASKDLIKNLEGCGRIVLFAATAGIEFDMLIRRYERVSPSKALWYQSIGSAYAESLCNAFCEEIKKEAGPAKPRFSPGYGDLPIEMQTDIFAALECERNIGLTLGDNLFMTPSKSVTAIMGLIDQTQKGKA